MAKWNESEMWKTYDEITPPVVATDGDRNERKIEMNILDDKSEAGDGESNILQRKASKRTAVRINQFEDKTSYGKPKTKKKSRTRGTHSDSAQKMDAGSVVATSPVRLADLLDEIVAIIQRYIQLPSESSAMIIALWITQTYCFQSFQYFGYLAIRSATPRCGKSQLLRVVSKMCVDTPPITTAPTPAVLYRNSRAVVILDEIDQLRNQDKDSHGAVLAVLNAGFERGNVIQRVDKSGGGSFEVKEFDVYGGKAIAGIEQLADTLSDRTFSIELKRVKSRMPRLRLHLMESTFQEIRDRLTQWMAEHEDALRETYGSLPDESPMLASFDDRFQDIAEPLVVLATLADQERPEGLSILDRLGEGLTTTFWRREPSGREGAFIAILHIVEQYIGEEDSVFISTDELLEECGQST